ncbi:DUF6531 domain-containing protein [Yinghuangia sp. YIM S10712]|uniref:DUF6531 domain-containing protein n=1 Tax=Yinghuangia sp. YIM S10712 TaxID=3436930 RepID=UPI003F535721
MSYGSEYLPVIVSSVSTAEQIPGSWQALRGISEQFGKFAAEAKQAADNLRPIDKPELWKGAASEGFRNDLHAMVQVLDLHAGVYPKIAKDLFDYSEVIRLAEGECVHDIDPKAAAVFQTMAAQEGEQILYDQAKARRDADVAAGVPKDCLVPLPAKPDREAVADALLQLRKQLGRLVQRNTEANTECYLRLRGYIDELRQTPNISFNAFVDGVRDGVVDLAKLAWTLDPARAWVEPQAYFTDLAAIAKGMTQPLYDPVGFAQDVKLAAGQTWDQFLANPAYATGRLVPDLTLAAASGGAGPAATQAMSAAAARVAAQREALRLAREQAERDARNGSTPESVPPGARTETGEPVNAATGEMILVQRDVELPGALPLQLNRRHLSRSEPGRLFGRRWASTLDQHVRLGGEGAVFVTEGGVELAYPVPEPGVPVMPVGGDRWPLEWDGLPGGVFTVTDPRRGWSWSFAPVPGRAGPVLPIRSISDRNGNRIEFSYDKAGMPYEVVHSGGYRIAVDTADERVAGLRLLGADPATHARSADSSASIDLVRFAYDEPGNVTEVVNSSGRPLVFTYDDGDRITSWTDRNGNWYQYTYDEVGRCVHGVGTDGVMDNTFEYDVDAQVTRMTDALGAVRTFAWDRLGRVVAETDPLGNTVHTEWDAFHRRVSVTDALGQTTRLAYDEEGNLIGVVHPDGTYTVADFDLALCRPTQIINPDGTRRRYTWDERGNLLSLVDEAGARTQYSYNASGALTQVTDALGGVTRYAPDAAGLPVSIADPLGRTTHVSRDAFGRTAVITDPLGHTTRLAHTVEGKPGWRELADGSRESWTWDAEGNLLHHLNAAGFTTRYESGPFDLPVAQTGPDGNRYTFTYDAELRLTAVTNPQDLSWTYRYNAAGRLTSETDFNGRTLTYRHDPAGHLISRVNGAGEEVAYARDPFGKVTESVHTATGRTTTYVYDPAGRLVRATNPDVDLTFTRDACGRILTETSNGRTLSRAAVSAARFGD